MPAEMLERQVFQLLWHEWGYGLSITYDQVMGLPVSRFSAFGRMRQEQLERVAKAAKGEN